MPPCTNRDSSYSDFATPCQRSGLTIDAKRGITSLPNRYTYPIVIATITHG